MSLKFADYLKQENAIKALLDLLYQLDAVKARKTRFGGVRHLSEAQMSLFATRMYNKQRER